MEAFFITGQNFTPHFFVGKLRKVCRTTTKITFNVEQQQKSLSMYKYDAVLQMTRVLMTFSYAAHYQSQAHTKNIYTHTNYI